MIVWKCGEYMSVTITSLAHAAFQIKAAGKIIYVDLEEYAQPRDQADLVLVTHSHTDHCDPGKIKKVLKEETIIIAPEDCAKKIGKEITTLLPGEEAKIDGLIIKAVHAYNIRRFRSPGTPFHPKGFGVGYLIMAEGKTIYHAGDTDFIPEMEQIKGVDVALLPTGDTYTMDNKEAADAAIAINPAISIPMHTWGNATTEFKKKVEAGSSTRVITLDEGEAFTVE
jgi:L-ascorbate metabolism protein UlaG (beta-lactamase superfamily)